MNFTVLVDALSFLASLAVLAIFVWLIQIQIRERKRDERDDS